MEIRESALIRVNDDDVGQTVIDEVFDIDESARFKKNHPIADSVDQFIARDPGDSLVFIKDGVFKFWDSTSGKISVLGTYPSEFVLGYEE